MAASPGDLVSLATAAVNTAGFAAGFYLFVTGRIHGSGEIDRLAEDKARVIGERNETAQQRDVLQELIRRDLVPLLASFTSATSSLLPILQDIVRTREGEGRERREGRGRD